MKLTPHPWVHKYSSSKWSKGRRLQRVSLATLSRLFRK